MLEEDRASLRVRPNDIDFNLHMNNARYLSVMDYARTAPAGPHAPARAHPAFALAAAGGRGLGHLPPLPALFSRLPLTSRLVCWDERWFYIEQTFTGRDEVWPRWLGKGALRNAKGSVEPQQVIEAVPRPLSPPMPEAMAAWNELTREKLQAGS